MIFDSMDIGLKPGLGAVFPAMVWKQECYQPVLLRNKEVIKGGPWRTLP